MKKYLLYIGIFIFSIAIIYRLILFFMGLKISSWFRTPWHNIEVGGKINSRHLIGWAFDIIPANHRTHEKLLSLGIFKSVLLEKDHIHTEIV